MTVTEIMGLCEEPHYRIQLLTWKTDGTWYWKDRDNLTYESLDAAVTKAREVRKEQVDRMRPGVRRLREGVRVIDDLTGRAHWGEKDRP